MLNLRAEYQNQMELYAFCRELARKENKAEAWAARPGHFRLCEEALRQSRGLSRALLAVAWGEWYGVACDHAIWKEDNAAIGRETATRRRERVLLAMKRWDEQVTDSYLAVQEASGKWDEKKREAQLKKLLNRREKLAAVRLTGARQTYYDILCEAAALGEDGRSLAELKVPVRVLCSWLAAHNGKYRSLMLLVLYYHYAPKDEEGFVYMPAVDFGLWAGTGRKFYETYRNSVDQQKSWFEECRIGDQINSPVKFRVTEKELLWRETERGLSVLMRDDGERGLMRQLDSIAAMNYVIPGKWKRLYEGYEENPDARREMFLWLTVALNPRNWAEPVEAPQRSYLQLPGAEAPSDPTRRPVWMTRVQQEEWEAFLKKRYFSHGSQMTSD